MTDEETGPCAACDGTGWDEDMEEACYHCHGVGWID